MTDGDGVAGNPTLALANDLSALEGLSSTGFAVRTASDTWAQRTITNISNQTAVTNGNGVAGNPTVGLADNAVFPGTDAITVPVGTSGQEGSASNGKVRYNSTLSKLRAVIAGSWETLATEGFVTGGYQPLDSDLTALAGLSSTGLIVRTGSGTANVAL